MSNAPYYRKEQALKQHVRTMSEAELRDRMLEFIHGAPVGTVMDMIEIFECPEPAIAE